MAELVSQWVACGYGGGGKNDIMVFEANSKGETIPLYQYTQGDCPSFGCFAKGRIYTVSEQEDSAHIYSYRWNGKELVQEGKIKVPGTLLCHLFAGEQALFGSCYGSGDFFAVDYDLQQLVWHSPAVGAVKTPHAHWMQTDREGKYILGADLGQDTVWKFRLKDGLPQGERTPAVTVEAGQGPRQPLVLADGSLAVIAELKSGLFLFAHNNEEYELVQRVPATTLEVENYPGGGYAYGGDTVFVCNRGANTVAAFKQKDNKFLLLDEVPAGGTWPRGIYGWEEAGLVFVGCQHTSTVNILRWKDEKMTSVSGFQLEGVSCLFPLPQI